MWWSCSVCAVSSKLLTLYLTVTFAESVPTFSAVIDAISSVAPGNSFACAKGFTAILPTESAKAVVSCVSPSVFFVVGLHATSVADAATNASAVFKLVIFIPFDLIIFIIYDFCYCTNITEKSFTMQKQYLTQFEWLRSFDSNLRRCVH